MRNSCAWALLATIVLWLALAITTTTAETMIEVDENGDEYELKRFYIQGRQLTGDGSKSQCVVTRRKRSSRAAALPQSVSVSSQQLSVEQLPMVEHREGSATIGADHESGGTKRRYVAFTGVHLEPADEEDQNNDDQINDDDDDEEDFSGNEGQKEQQPKAQSQSQSQYVPAALALPLAQTSVSHLSHGVSVVANAASQANVAGDAGIVVVQSHQPPKVNPDTHAVFELRPVQQDVVQAPLHASASASAVTTVPGYYPFVAGSHPHWQEYGLPGDADADEDDDYDEEEEEDYDEFYYGQGGYIRDRPGYHPLGEYDEELITEDSPTTTTAVWSTGTDDDDIHPVINQANSRPNNNKKNKKNKKNQNKNQRNKNQRNKKQQLKRKQELAEKEQEEEQNQNQDNVNVKEQKQKQKKKPQQQQQQQESSLDVTKRPMKKPSSSGSGSGSSVSVSASSTDNTAAVAAISSSGDLAPNKNNNKNKNKKKRPSGSGGRPFWNILGRDTGSNEPTPAPVAGAEAAGAGAAIASDEETMDPVAKQAVLQAVRRNFGDFGGRKRTNLRFVA
ncbi:Hypothetical predicted protein [Drosophila guanche]|uniref:Uncharacterized protein n=1 Tax=Drosophila guanche TaxID=7266 RepID=A0A3B0JTM9_DROGU|nr:Hypothetical predicted protein [Drosophila guanche]